MWCADEAGSIKHMNSFFSILLGTSNTEKLQALSLLLHGLPLNLLSPEDLESRVGPDENGGTHHGNASLKAQYWSIQCDGLAIASDGGLVIPSAFGTWSSLYTNRIFADIKAKERPSALLELLDRYQITDRRAFWIEAVAIALKGDLVATWVARSSMGEIAHTVNEQVPVSGFWVNTVWYFSDLGKYYGSLSSEEIAISPDHWSVLHSEVRVFFEKYLINMG
jgi:inosine/xanthosine triphosphate pyrophosphatase family protein